MTTSLLSMDSLSPGRDLDGYVRTVSAFPILSADDEKALTERLYYDNDVDAARQLVLHHLRFVVHLARSYSGYGLAQGDLIQEGNVGLMKAVKRFNPEFGVRLVSFAVHWIKAEMHEFILRNWRIVKIATTKAQRKLFFKLRSNKKRLGWLTGEEARAVASDLGVEPSVVTQMEGRLAARDMAFDGYSDDEAENWGAPAQFLSREGADPAELVAAEEWRDSSTKALADSMAVLDERSQDIVRSRWLGEEKATLHQLAGKYGVSAERIRQLEKSAMKKLKAVLEA
ncbi:MAG: RNA polymerase sigma factor RpoH [Gammaproteobacteria bacterium]|nr:MAG: RNA polymerase sigma factor RpoH [Gammaproteobacteria bacterium]